MTALPERMYRPAGSCPRQTGRPACRAPMGGGGEPSHPSHEPLQPLKAALRTGQNPAGWRAGARSSCQDAAPGDCRRRWRIMSRRPPVFDGAGHVAASHLVIQPVTGQAGHAGGLIDAVRQPFGRWIWSWLARHPPAGIWWFRVTAGTWVACDPPAIMHFGGGKPAITIRNKGHLRHACRSRERVRDAGRRRTAGGSRRPCGRGQPGSTPEWLPGRLRPSPSFQ